MNAWRRVAWGVCAALGGALACGTQEIGSYTPEAEAGAPAAGGSTGGFAGDAGTSSAAGADDAAGAAGQSSSVAGAGGSDGEAGAGGMAVAGAAGDSGTAGPKIVDFASSDTHACAVSSDGRVQCWGPNVRGELGLGDTTGSLYYVGDDETPASVGDVQVGGHAVQVSAGPYATCVRFDTGGVRCWGAYPGPFDRQGDPNIGDDETPASIPEVELGGRATQIKVGGVHACALLEDGSVRCWGLSDVGCLGYGYEHPADQLWIGDNESPASAGYVPVGGKVIQIDTTNTHVCAVLETHAVRCWGSGDSGKLGYGSTENVGDNETPAFMGDVDVGGPVKQVAAGGNQTCALLMDGSVRCWGAPVPYVEGRENIGDDEPASAAPLIELGAKAVYIAAGLNHTCAIVEGGGVRCWGEGVYTASGYARSGSIGADETPAEAGDIPLGGPAVQVAAAWFHMCARLENGDIRCWGGDPTMQYPVNPSTRVPLGQPFVDVIGAHEFPDYFDPIRLFDEL